MVDFCWLSDEQWARIEPLLPRDTRGMPRVDYRRAHSGIVHAKNSGGRWGDCPEQVYGPRNTLCNRFRRWTERCVWERIFAQFAGDEGVPYRLFIASSFIKAHRTAGGVNGGGLSHGIGITKGGRNTKLHAICDKKGRSQSSCFWLKIKAPQASRWAGDDTWIGNIPAFAADTCKMHCRGCDIKVLQDSIPDAAYRAVTGTSSDQITREENRSHQVR